MIAAPTALAPDLITAPAKVTISNSVEPCEDDVVICCASVDASVLMFSGPATDLTRLRCSVLPSQVVEVAATGADPARPG